MASQEVLLVTTPEPSSLTDSYSLLKTLYKNPRFNRDNTKISVLANRVTSTEEGRSVYEKLNSVVMQFLKGELQFAGVIPQDSALEKAVRQQKTVSLNAPSSKSARAFEVMASNILNNEQKQVRISSGISHLFSSLWKQND